VRDPVVHNEVLSLIINKAIDSGFFPLALTHSPLKGRAGNIEYLVHLSYIAKPDGGFKESQIEDVVRAAHDYCSQQKRDD
jgi:23S rRNA (cytidine1920-2'-O)/16S rRNA (cytidine1409-2'-O)-methyltransferase